MDNEMRKGEENTGAGILVVWQTAVEVSSHDAVYFFPRIPWSRCKCPDLSHLNRHCPSL